MAKGRSWSTPPSMFREKIDSAVAERTRVIAMAMLQEVVLRSPVGNPDLWKVNQERKAHNIAMADAYDTMAAQLGNKKLTKKEREQNFFVKDQAVGKGYVGGRFRANNIVTVGDPSYAQTDSVDPSGATTISNGATVIQSVGPYSVVYIQNNLPYSEALEDGHSTQAPGGIYAVSFHGVSQAYSS
ncbi:HK97 gp10 family phage protein [Pseudomonas aeruginosa]|uniref:HK97 gp10 family phage protein n=1 Tax=Pseudomonas aeruginosa TaxID=287 RepID=UPI001EF51F2F|nr:HK97 gp10 family phage protein [Pseudomonas aeruginosa]